jgi:hypothetical protein
MGAGVPAALPSLVVAAGVGAPEAAAPVLEGVCCAHWLWSKAAKPEELIALVSLPAPEAGAVAVDEADVPDCWGAGVHVAAIAFNDKEEMVTGGSPTWVVYTHITHSSCQS